MGLHHDVATDNKRYMLLNPVTVSPAGPAAGRESRHQIAVARVETLGTAQRTKKMPNWLSERWTEWDYPPGAGKPTWGPINIPINFPLSRYLLPAHGAVREVHPIHPCVLVHVHILFSPGCCPGYPPITTE